MVEEPLTNYEADTRFKVASIRVNRSRTTGFPLFRLKTKRNERKAIGDGSRFCIVEIISVGLRASGE